MSSLKILRSLNILKKDKRLLTLILVYLRSIKLTAKNYTNGKITLTHFNIRTSKRTE